MTVSESDGSLKKQIVAKYMLHLPNFFIVLCDGIRMMFSIFQFQLTIRHHRY